MLFSIVIPTYNYADFLDNALQSVFRQQYTHYEVIVVDDGSTDHTPSICEKFKNLFADRFQVITQKNSGPGAARNRGVSVAKGDYILFLDADDELEQDALIHFRRGLAEHRHADCVIGGHRSVDGKQAKVIAASPLAACKLSNLKNYIRKKIHLCNGAMLISRKIALRCPFPEKLGLCEDIPVFAQTLATADMITIPQSVVRIRKHINSRRRNPQAVDESVRALPGLVFNPDLIPTEFYPLKREFTARMHLRAFRLLYQTKQFRDARRYYYRAIRTYPRLLLLGGYFKKFIKSFLHWHQR